MLIYIYVYTYVRLKKSGYAYIVIYLLVHVLFQCSPHQPIWACTELSFSTSPWGSQRMSTAPMHSKTISGEYLASELAAVHHDAVAKGFSIVTHPFLGYPYLWKSHEIPICNQQKTSLFGKEHDLSSMKRICNWPSGDESWRNPDPYCIKTMFCYEAIEGWIAFCRSMSPKESRGPIR